jgi:FtsZ-binding cell division protein ZapB
LEGDHYVSVPHELPPSVLSIVKHFQFAHQPFETSMNAIHEFARMDQQSALVQEKQRLEKEREQLEREKERLDRETQEWTRIKQRIAALL